jgi:polysaccharide export outer membrane protein
LKTVASLRALAAFGMVMWAYNSATGQIKTRKQVAGTALLGLDSAAVPTRRERGGREGHHGAPRIDHAAQRGDPAPRRLELAGASRDTVTAMRFVVLLVSIVLVACAACGSAPPKYKYGEEPDPRNKDVVLGVGDTIAVQVWGPDNKELNTEVTIRADGRITMLLIGDVKAAGMTPAVLGKAIHDQLATFMKWPGAVQGTEPVTVAVVLKAWRSYIFTIQGEVQRQGVFTSDHYVTVAEAIAMAGGPTRFAKRGELKLFRTGLQSKETHQIPFDYDMLVSGQRRDMNICVLAGDVIYMP